MSSTCTAALIFISGCGVSLFPEPETEVKEVLVPEQYCPAIRQPERPTPVTVPAPDFLVVTQDDPRLNGVALVCLDADGYEQLSETIEELIRYSVDNTAIIEYYEKSIDAQKGKQDNE